VGNAESARMTGAAFMKLGLAPITWTIRIWTRFLEDAC
jgi:hypothetical protein